jgi:integrase
MIKLRLKYDRETKQYFTRFQHKNRRERKWFGSVRKEALEDLQNFKDDLLNGKVPLTAELTTHVVASDGSKDIRIEELAHKHLIWVQANRSKGTYLVRRHYCNAFVKYVGPCMVSSLNRKTMDDFYTWAKLHHSKSRNGGNEYLRHVKVMLRWGEEMELCNNPIKRFPPMSVFPSETKRFNDEEIKVLLAKATDALRDMLLFGLLTGLRPQELRALEKDHIHHTENGYCIVLEQHKTAGSTKTPQPRSVPLSTSAEQILIRRLHAQPKSKMIFLNGDGGPYTAVSFRNRFERLCKRAGVPIRPPYALRHTFATGMAENRTNPTILGHLMGHTTTRTTQRYIANNSEYHRQMVEELAERFVDIANEQSSKKVASKVASNSISKNEETQAGCVTACRKAG